MLYMFCDLKDCDEGKKDCKRYRVMKMGKGQMDDKVPCKINVGERILYCIELGDREFLFTDCVL